MSQRNVERFALGLLLSCLLLIAGIAQSSCAAIKPVLRTLDDAARWHCANHYSGVRGVSIEDAWETFCQKREEWAPWIDPVIRAQQEGVAVATGVEPASSAAPAVSVAPKPQCPEPAKPPEPPAAPAQSADPPAPPASSDGGT